MSCMMLTDEAIAALALACVARAPHALTTRAPDLVFEMLWRANAAAYADRYGDPAGTSPAWCDVRKPADRDLAEVVRLIATVQHYRYNACDWRAWDDSEADRATEAVGHALIRALPGYDGADLAWQGAPSRGWTMVVATKPSPPRACPDCGRIDCRCDDTDDADLGDPLIAAFSFGWGEVWQDGAVTRRGEPVFNTREV